MKNISGETDYNAVQTKISYLKEKYKNLKTAVIGKSVAGREITALQIGRGPEYVLYAGAFHGTERITAALLLKFAEELLSAQSVSGSLWDLDVNRIMLGRGLIIVPMVNPDGCEISIHGAKGCGYSAAAIYKICGGEYSKYNANLHGVDINHNFDAGWEALHRLEQSAGIYGPAPTRYGGSRPESEPETAALVSLCQRMPICHALAFHSQGEVIYWDYGEHTPQKSRKMAEILSDASGYSLDEPEGLAVGGGFKDWFIEKFYRPAFTVEIGLGENPLDPSELDGIYEKTGRMMTIGIMI